MNAIYILLIDAQQEIRVAGGSDPWSGFDGCGPQMEKTQLRYVHWERTAAWKTHDDDERLFSKTSPKIDKWLDDANCKVIKAMVCESSQGFLKGEITVEATPHEDYIGEEGPSRYLVPFTYSGRYYIEYDSRELKEDDEL